MSRAIVRHLSCIVIAAVFLSACDGGGSVDGNQLPESNQPGSQPSTTLSFASREAQVSVNNGVLLRTLAAPASIEYTFDDLQVLVFAPMCAGCHTGGGVTQPSVFDFTTADASYQTLLNQSSQHSSGSSLVVAGNADGSYLMDSLEGRQLSGSRMPMRSAAVPDELLLSIRAWIDDGANR